MFAYFEKTFDTPIAAGSFGLNTFKFGVQFPNASLKTDFFEAEFGVQVTIVHDARYNQSNGKFAYFKINVFEDCEPVYGADGNYV